MMKRSHNATMTSVELSRLATRDRQGFPGKLVDNAQHAIGLSVMGPVGDKVVGPDVIGPRRPQTDARSIIQPEAASFGLSAWDLKPLTPPQPFNSLLVDRPARPTQHLGDAAIRAAQRAEELLNEGDVDCAVAWHRIHEAIEELRRAGARARR
jgi:hypothetical protein